MASDGALTLSFKVQSQGAGTLKQLAGDAKGFEAALKGVSMQAGKLNTGALNFAAISTGISQAQRMVEGLQNTIRGLTDAYAVQEEAERQLAVTMRNSMDATDEQIQRIKDLCAAQQEQGIIGDEVQMAGAQELSTYLGLTSSLETLIPVLNDMNAQQYGLNATTESSVTIATMLGKVMQGQTGALKRYGYEFDSVQEHILKYGEESERAAVLAEVVSQSVGGMNAQLAQTDSGRMKQLANALGDVKEQLGKAVSGLAPAISLLANLSIVGGNLMKLYAAFTATAKAMGIYKVKALAAKTVTVMCGVSASRTAVTMRVMSAAMRSGAYSATALKLALRGLMNATGVGIAISVVTEAITYLMNKMDDARESIGDTSDSLEDFGRSLRDLGALVASNAQEEMGQLERLYQTAKNDTKSRTERAAAVAELQRLYPDYFRNISKENIQVSDLTRSYNALKDNILATARARAAATKIEQNAGLLIEKDTELTELRAAREAQSAAVEAARARFSEAQNLQNRYTLNPISATNATDAASMRAGDAFRQAQTNESARALSSAEEALRTTDESIERITQEIAEINAANEHLAEIAGSAPAAPDLVTPTTTTRSGGSTIRDEAAEAAAIDVSEVMGRNLQCLADYDKALSDLNKKMQYVGADEVRIIRGHITALEERRDATFGVAEAEVAAHERTAPKSLDQLNTIHELTEAISYLREVQESQSADEVAATEATIQAHERKLSALRRGIDLTAMQSEVDEINSLSGQELKVRVQGIGFDELTNKIKSLQEILADTENPVTEQQRRQIEGLIQTYARWRKESIGAFDTFRSGWDSVKGIAGGINGISDALSGNANAWEKITAIVDGFIQIYDGIMGVVRIIGMLTTASEGLTVAKTVEGAAQVAAGEATVGAAAEGVVASGAQTVANKAETASWAELAAAKFMAAHASIPFVGFAAGAAFAAGSTALIQGIGAMPFAKGGIAYGPTLGLFGEYAGASTNPEVVAPLDKLRSLIEPQGPVSLEISDFRLKGRTAVALIKQEYNHKSRTHG